MAGIFFPEAGNVRSLLFSQIPKTGGTAVIDTFRRLGAQIFLHNENNPMVGWLRCPSQHFHYDILDTVYNIEAFTHSFSIVRHPLERSVSSYLWSMRHVSSTSVPQSFDRWFESSLRAYEENTFAHDNHLRPQIQFTGPKLDCVYVYENGIEAIIKRILTAAGLDPLPNGFEVSRLNTSSEHTHRPKDSISISKETLALHRVMYATDYEMWYQSPDTST